MKTGPEKTAITLATAAPSLSTARQMLLIWIVANEQRRHAAGEVGLRYAAGLPLVAAGSKV